MDSICDYFIAEASDLLTLGCEDCIREAADRADPVAYVKALRCASGEKLWRVALEQLQCFCDDTERDEIAVVLDDNSY